jgi:5-oxoprolinase (ATP-hydrolysing)
MTDAVERELFSNRFRMLVGEMGERLRRSAVSVNVKERLDFSCGLLDPVGQLVANAPHIPVHLGALGLCVRTIEQKLSLRPGDVVVTNHPGFGGSHLPDVTVITPVFAASESRDGRELLGFVANRAHHAEIGGLRPGSMPPGARCLAEEGVVLEPFFLARGGRFDWSGVERRLLRGPWPSRAVEENLADLAAAVAANRRGAEILTAMAIDFGADVVRHFMQELAAQARDLAADALGRFSSGELEATERLDDGTTLRVRVHLPDFAGRRRTLIDFSGSAGVHSGNLNATPAIVRSAVLYVLRVLIDAPIPLNEGLLAGVDLRIPRGILNPHFPSNPELAPAVVGGNVETSQRLVDTLLKAFGVVACSQGTMNNVLFGDDSFAYYETVGGGCGAGPGWAGASGVHSHMTNTAITDPEILEQRYPVRLERFQVRRGSGGRGRFDGGDGLIREITFLRQLQLSVLTQHRSEGPYGVGGGRPGSAGRQTVFRGTGEVLELGSVDECLVDPGDRLLLETPGGGAWGERAKPEDLVGPEPDVGPD